MNILALETSTEFCSLVLSKEHVVLEEQSLAPQKHEQILLQWLETLLSNAQLTPSDIKYIGYSCGPGGFTGIRIGAAVAQGLSLAHNIPIIAVPTLQVIAQGVHREFGLEQIAVIWNARIEQIYFGLYELNKDGAMTAKVPDSIYNINAIPDIKDIAIVTDCSFIPKSSTTITGFYPKAKDVLFLSEQRIKSGRIMTDDLPVYLRSEDTWKKIT